jgi:quinol monooxygenase YgiN
MSETVGFCVIYRFLVREEAEEQFREGWTRLTEAIRDRRGGQGSRLHRAGGNLWVAYAQWPSREAWEGSRELPSADAEASALMSAAVTESFEPILLEPDTDLLQLLGVTAS